MFKTSIALVRLGQRGAADRGEYRQAAEAISLGASQNSESANGREEDWGR